MKPYLRHEFILTILILTTWSAISTAASITLNFSGKLTSSFDTLNVGDPFSGSYSFDSIIAANSGSTSSYAVFDSLSSASLTVGGFTASLGASTGLPEIQQDDVAGADRYGLVVRNPTGSSTIGGLGISSFGFRLDDTAGLAINDALNLLAAPSLSNFTSHTFLMFFGNPLTPSAFQVVTGTLETLSPPQTTLPEPNSLLLLIIGCLASMRCIKSAPDKTERITLPAYRSGPMKFNIRAS